MIISALISQPHFPSHVFWYLREWIEFIHVVKKRRVDTIRPNFIFWITLYPSAPSLCYSVKYLSLDLTGLIWEKNQTDCSNSRYGAGIVKWWASVFLQSEVLTAAFITIQTPTLHPYFTHTLSPKRRVAVTTWWGEEIMSSPHTT